MPTLLYDTSLAPANLSATGITSSPAAGGTLIAGSGMRDTQGGVWSVDGNHYLLGSPEGSASWQRDNLFFSNQGTGQSGQITEVIDLPAGQGSYVAPVIRYQSANTKYWCYIGNPWNTAANGVTFNIWKEVAGSDTKISSDVSFTGGLGIWRAVFDANGTTLTVSLYNLTTPGAGQVADPITVNPDGVNGAHTATVTDSSISSGGFAVASFNQQVQVSRIRLYGSPLSLSGTVTASTSGNTIVLSNTAAPYTTTSPSSYPLSGAGASGSTVTGVVLSNGGQTATLTVTAGGVTGSNNLTIVDPNGNSSSISVTAPVGLLIGWLQVVSVNTGNQLSLVANGAGTIGLSAGSGSGYSYNIYRDTLTNTSPGASTLITTITSLGTTPYVDTTAVPGTVYYYRVVGTDSASNLAYTAPPSLNSVSQAVSLATAWTTSLVSFNLVGLGNSIAANIINAGGLTSGPYSYANPTDVTSPIGVCASRLARISGVRRTYFLNAGSNGSTIYNWRKNDTSTATSTPPGTYNTTGGAINSYTVASNMMTSLISANPSAKQVFTAMFGTNDARNDTSAGGGIPMTVAQYMSYSLSVYTSLLTDFPNASLFINYSPYFTPNSAITPAVWGESSLAKLVQMQAAENSIVATLSTTFIGRVFSGDKLAYGWFADNYATAMVAQSGSNGNFYLHPNTIGAAELGNFWVQPIYSNLIFSGGAISLTKYDPNEHTVSLTTGTQVLSIRHISDLQLSVLRTTVPNLENANDTTGLPSIVSN